MTKVDSEQASKEAHTLPISQQGDKQEVAGAARAKGGSLGCSLSSEG